MKKVIILGLALVVLATGCSIPKKQKTLKPEEAKAVAVKFINENLMQPGNDVTIKDITEESGLYKMTVSLPRGQEVVSYMTKDGSTFFPQSMNVAETEAKAKENNPAQGDGQASAPVATVSKKSDKPVVEAFVMSHCPFGTQIEKGLLPVYETLKNKADIQIKFVDYAMHGEKEIKEQMLQYCINKVENAKYMSYLQCFLGGNDLTDKCLKDNKIDQAKVNGCVASTDKEFKVMEKFNDKTTWLNGRFPAFDIHKADNDKYGVKGSPTLVINGEEVSSGRDSNSLLKVICSAFNTAPSECSQELSKAQPSAGFGYGESDDAAASAQCGN